MPLIHSVKACYWNNAWCTKHWIASCGMKWNLTVSSGNTCSTIPTLLFANALSVISRKVCQSQQSQFFFFLSLDIWLWKSSLASSLSLFSHPRTCMITTRGSRLQPVGWKSQEQPEQTSRGHFAAGSPLHLIPFNVNAFHPCIMCFIISFRYRKMNSTGKSIIQDSLDQTRMMSSNKHWPVHLKDNLFK